MKLKKLAAAIGVALPLSLAALTAHAASTVLSFEDDDIDFLGTIGTNGQWVPKVGATSFSVGDVLVSIFEINNYSGPGGIPAGMELTGVAAVKIKNINGSTITFESASGALLTLFGNNFGGEIKADSAVAMFMNSNVGANNLDVNFTTNPAASCTSLANCVAEAIATDGATGGLFQVDGWGFDSDEYWVAETFGVGGNPSDVANTSGSVGVAQFNAALTTTFHRDGTITYKDIQTGAECAGPAVGCIAGPTITGPLTGGLGLNATILADGAFARSDFDASKRLLIPEPGTLALAGLSLLGLAGLRRRQKQ